MFWLLWWWSYSSMITPKLLAVYFNWIFYDKISYIFIKLVFLKPCVYACVCVLWENRCVCDSTRMASREKPHLSVHTFHCVGERSSCSLQLYTLGWPINIRCYYLPSHCWSTWDYKHVTIPSFTSVQETLTRFSCLYKYFSLFLVHFLSIRSNTGPKVTWRGKGLFDLKISVTVYLEGKPKQELKEERTWKQELKQRP